MDLLNPELNPMGALVVMGNRTQDVLLAEGFYGGVRVPVADDPGALRHCRSWIVEVGAVGFTRKSWCRVVPAASSASRIVLYPVFVSVSSGVSGVFPPWARWSVHRGSGVHEGSSPMRSAGLHRLRSDESARNFVMRRRREFLGADALRCSGERAACGRNL